MTFHIHIFLRILKIHFKNSVCTILEDFFMKRACKLMCNFLCRFTHCIVHALTYFVVKFCCDIVNIGDGTHVWNLLFLSNVCSPVLQRDSACVSAMNNNYSISENNYETKNKRQEEINTKHVCGEPYVSTSGKQAQEKRFTLVSKCCKKKCFEKLTLHEQLELFTTFYSRQEKSLQDSFLPRCMEASVMKTKTLDPKKQHNHNWRYSVSTFGSKKEACQK